MTAALLLEEPGCMADEEKRTYGPAKVDVRALALARKAAAMQDKTLADYISDVILEVAPRDIHEATRHIPRPPKRGRTD